MLSRRTPSRRRRAGFTLTEVLLVLAIIGVIAAMVIPNLIGSQQKANVQATKNSITAFENIVKNYAVANAGTFPEGGRDEVITMLLNPPVDEDGKTVAPYMEQSPKDAWGQSLYYEYPTNKVQNGIKPAIWSSGQNKQNEDGNGDDVNNWQDTGK
ncbi:prepilin-type N-terminal cleavage/methylation domain-containing protein [bacterium]|nr:prepilin-type N-terminal cleavage/methylation domain-containing protein [bacterium]